MDLGGIFGDGEEGLEFEYIVKGEWEEFVNGLDVGCKIERG